MRHGWLAIDPGITTGWALLDDDGDVLGTAVVGTHDVRKTLDTLVRVMYTKGIVLDVIVERMPNVGRMSGLSAQLEFVRKEIAAVIDTYELRVTLVAPGEWKPSRVARTTQLPRKWQGQSLTEHQQDAIRMGRYVMEAKE